MGLSDRSKAILAHVAVPLADGWTHGEIAKQVGRSTRWVSGALEDLREEIREQQRA